GRSGVIESSSNAGMAVSSVLPVAKLAAEAVDAMAAFSRMLSGVRDQPALQSKRHNANDRTHAVSPIPMGHPVLRPKYRVADASTRPSAAPVTAARTVSCGASPR